jgi:hypothetical protein
MNVFRHIGSLLLVLTSPISHGLVHTGHINSRVKIVLDLQIAKQTTFIYRLTLLISDACLYKQAFHSRTISQSSSNCNQFKSFLKNEGMLYVRFSPWVRLAVKTG